MFTGRSYTPLGKSYWLQEEFITPYSLEQNGMVEPVVLFSVTPSIYECRRGDLCNGAIVAVNQDLLFLIGYTTPNLKHNNFH